MTAHRRGPAWRWLTVAASAATTLLLAACANLPPLPALPWQTTPIPTVHLNAWLPAASDAAATLNEAHMADFIASTDAVSVTVTLLDTQDDSLDVLLKSDLPPDLLEVDLFRLPSLVDAGHLAAFPPQGTASADIHPSLVDAATVDGSLYCLPKEAHTLGLYYNRALFDDAGIAYPDDAWTWADLRAAAEAISGLPTVKFSAYGLILSADVSRWLPFYLQAGGAWRGGESLDLIARNEALTYYTDLLSDGFAIEPGYYGSIWGGPIFGNGRVGMAIEGNWLADYLDAQFPKIEYGVAPLPGGPSGPASITFGTCYAVTAASMTQEHAFALAAHLAGDRAMEERLDTSMAMPARQALAAAWEARHPTLRAHRIQLDNAVVWQASLGAVSTLDELQSSIEALFAGDPAVDETADEAPDEVIDEPSADLPSP